jgi:hypothetical protein
VTVRDWSKQGKVADFGKLRKFTRTVAFYIFKLSYRLIDEINLGVDNGKRNAPHAIGQRTYEKEAFLLHSTFCGIHCIRVIF